MLALPTSAHPLVFNQLFLSCSGPENEAKWQYHLTAADIQEIEAALEHVKSHDLSPDVRCVMCEMGRMVCDVEHVM